MNVGLALLLAGAALAVGAAVGWTNAKLWLLSTLAGAAAAFIAAVRILCSGEAWSWRSNFDVGGEPLYLRLDSIGAVFLALLGVVGAAGTIYSREYWSARDHPRSARTGRVWWSVLLAAIAFVLLASNGLHFLIAWEIFTVSSYFLITLDRSRAEVRAAGWLYLGASHTATLCLFAFFAILAARTGSWELGPMREQTALAPVFWLALFAFGVKAGLFPLHIWLPSAHANAPSHVSAIMSGMTIKLGIYGLVRFSGWLPVPASLGWVVALLGAASAVLGVAFALGQHDLKRLLAYHSVENIGIILVGVGFALIAVGRENAAWGRLALAGGLLHVWNHGLFKSLLFLGAGAVLHATGTREMSRLGGLWQKMPWTAGLFALGAVAISGLPPLNGFVSEFLVYLGLFDAVNAGGYPALGAALATLLLGLTGALALACFVKVCGVVFLGAPRDERASRAHECGPWMRGPMLGLAAACVAIGLFPALFWPALSRAAATWNPAWETPTAPAPLDILGGFHAALAFAVIAGASLLWNLARRNALRRALTWDCGYAAPAPRMQYTAGSFAGIVTEWFAWILRPQRHEHAAAETFPARASLERHTPETVLEHVLEPAGRVVMRIATAARKLQHGRVQTYIVYLVIGVAALGLLAFLGETR